MCCSWDSKHSQLDRIYGKSGAQELLDLFRTKFFFAVSDNNIAEYASRSLGEIEIDETKESLSYGSNTMRDGVNINSAQKIKRLVLPDEVKNLPTRTCFVKLCGNYPITMLKVNLQAHSKMMMFFYKLFNKNNKNNQKISGMQLASTKKNIKNSSISTAARQSPQEDNILNNSTPVMVSNKRQIFNEIKERD